MKEYKNDKLIQNHQNNPASLKNTSDFLGTASSVICLTHCILMPILFSGQALLTTSQHETLDYIFIGISFLSVYYSTKNTSSARIQAALWSFFGCFLFGIIFSYDYYFMIYLAHLGSFGLAFTHILNIRYCIKCKNENERQ